MLTDVVSSASAYNAKVRCSRRPVSKKYQPRSKSLPTTLRIIVYASVLVCVYSTSSKIVFGVASILRTQAPESEPRDLSVWNIDPKVFGAFYRKRGGTSVKWGTVEWRRVHDTLVWERRLTETSLGISNRLREYKTCSNQSIVLVSSDGNLIMNDNEVFQREDVSQKLRTKTRRDEVLFPLPHNSLLKVPEKDAHKPTLATLNEKLLSSSKSKLVNSSWIVAHLKDANVPMNHVAVNVGCNDGKTIDPVYELLELGWKALCIEPDPQLAATARSNLEQFAQNAIIHEGFLGVDNIADIFEQHDILYREAGDIDIIKLDIDSFDAYLMDRVLEVTRPKLFQIEYNVRFPPPVSFNTDYPNQYTFKGDYSCRKFGTSLEFLNVIVGKKHGYVPIYGEVNDVWFVDRQYLHVFGQPPNTTDLYRSSTLTEDWIDKLDFFFGRPNLDRAELATVLGDAVQAVKVISNWMLETPDEDVCHPGNEWAFGVTIPDI